MPQYNLEFKQLISIFFRATVLQENIELYKQEFLRILNRVSKH